MTGGDSLHVWVDPSNVDSVLHWSYLESNRAIRIRCNYLVRARVGLLVFLFSTDVQHDFVSCFVLMWDASTILSSVILIDQSLFMLPYDLPVGSVFDIEYQIPSKNELAWGTPQGSMIRASDGKCCST